MLDGERMFVQYGAWAPIAKEMLVVSVNFEFDEEASPHTEAFSAGRWIELKIGEPIW
jgi:hypothetical protein